MNDDSKKLILARRARFVAAALAGVGVACGKEPAQPQPCLSPVYVAPPDAEPMPCLSPPVYVPPDADTTTTEASDAGAGAEPDAAKPMPCLSPRPNPTPPPRPCLSVVPPTKPVAPKQ